MVSEGKNVHHTSPDWSLPNSSDTAQHLAVSPCYRRSNFGIVIVHFVDIRGSAVVSVDTGDD